MTKLDLDRLQRICDGATLPLNENNFNSLFYVTARREIPLLIKRVRALEKVAEAISKAR